MLRAKLQRSEGSDVMVDERGPVSPEKMASIEELLHQSTYTPEQAASLLGMDVQRIYAAAFRGDLTARIVGDDVVSVERSDLVDWLRGRS
jgi:hypothetical protein